MKLGDSLLEIYRRLLRAHGPQHWWPADSPFEVMVGAVLTQAAAWTNVRKALSNIVNADALSPEAIRALTLDELARLVHPSGYFNAKARKLKALVEFLGHRFQDDVDAMARDEMDSLREELLGVHGIGPETADDILLYAVGKPAFVIDAYTMRLFSRLDLAPPKSSYDAFRSVFMDHLPADVELFKEYHALIVRHAKDVCRKSPVCDWCCLLEVCPSGNSNTACPPV